MNGFTMGELKRRQYPLDTEASERADHGGSALDLQVKHECGALQGESWATKRSWMAKHRLWYHKDFSEEFSR